MTQKNINSVKKSTIKVKGMHCVGCETIIEDTLSEIEGVKSAQVDYTKEEVVIEFDPERAGLKSIIKAIENRGYNPEEII